MAKSPETIKYLSVYTPPEFLTLNKNYLKQVEAVLEYRATILSILDNSIQTVITSNSMSSSSNLNGYSSVGNNSNNGIKYRMVTVGNDYELTSDDCNGNTIIRVNSTADTNLYIPINIADDTHIGVSLTIYNTQDFIVDIVPKSEVTLIANDSSLLRRSGSAITLIYSGNNNWDMYGEIS